METRPTPKDSDQDHKTLPPLCLPSPTNQNALQAIIIFLRTIRDWNDLTSKAVLSPFPGTVYPFLCIGSPAAFIWTEHGLFWATCRCFERGSAGSPAPPTPSPVRPTDGPVSYRVRGVYLGCKVHVTHLGLHVNTPASTPDGVVSMIL
ncbi:hypothetical protein Bbelb_194190 [Branchiostoma belcheri]|nr:hypothetical protein Bbelb_194190 [Branchiostoma belcheri]